LSVLRVQEYLAWLVMIAVGWLACWLVIWHPMPRQQQAAVSQSCELKRACVIRQEFKLSHPDHSTIVRSHQAHLDFDNLQERCQQLHLQRPALELTAARGLLSRAKGFELQQVAILQQSAHELRQVHTERLSGSWNALTRSPTTKRPKKANLAPDTKRQVLDLYAQEVIVLPTGIDFIGNVRLKGDDLLICSDRASLCGVAGSWSYLDAPWIDVEWIARGGDLWRLESAGPAHFSVTTRQLDLEAAAPQRITIHNEHKLILAQHATAHWDKGQRLPALIELDGDLRYRAQSATAQELPALMAAPKATIWPDRAAALLQSDEHSCVSLWNRGGTQRLYCRDLWLRRDPLTGQMSYHSDGAVSFEIDPEDPKIADTPRWQTLLRNKHYDGDDAPPSE